jgi:hypothetical protein
MNSETRAEQIGRDPMKAVPAELVFGEADYSGAGAGAAHRRLSPIFFLNELEMSGPLGFLLIFNA